MRLKNIGKSLLLGGAFALALSACKDDTTNNTSDAGYDAGHDAGRDSGQDSGPPPMPAHLRVAHLAWGTGVGNLHLCAYSAADGSRLLITSDALATGNFQGATAEAPLRPGSISKHFDVPATVLGLLGNRVIEVYRQSEAGADTMGGIGTCAPTAGATILASATLGGSGAGAIQLTPGSYATVAIIGANGTDTMVCGATQNQACPGVSILTMQDEVTTSAAATARVRVANADARLGAPGICTSIYGMPTPTYSAVNLATNPYIGAAAPAYGDLTPVSAPSDGDGGVYTLAITAHVAGSGTTSGTLCETTVVPSPTVAGVLPNNGLIAQYAANAAAGAGTVRPDLPANKVTTLFVAPLTLQFRDLTGSGGTCAGGVAGPAGCPTCVPAGPSNAATCIPADACFPSAPGSGCITMPVAIPIADSTP